MEYTELSETQRKVILKVLCDLSKQAWPVQEKIAKLEAELNLIRQMKKELRGLLYEEEV